MDASILSFAFSFLENWLENPPNVVESELPASQISSPFSLSTTLALILSLVVQSFVPEIEKN